VEIAIIAKLWFLEQRINCTPKLDTLHVNGQFLDLVRHGKAEKARAVPSGFKDSRIQGLEDSRISD
jgi:hypothetical protein